MERRFPPAIPGREVLAAAAGNLTGPGPLHPAATATWPACSHPKGLGRPAKAASASVAIPCEDVPDSCHKLGINSRILSMSLGHSLSVKRKPLHSATTFGILWPYPLPHGNTVTEDRKSTR